MSSKQKQKEPSRLRGVARREAIILAATQIITEYGAGRLSIDEVAKRASASKETVYRQFGNRVGLLIVVLSEFTVANITNCPKMQDGEQFDEGLRRLGLWYLTMIMRPEVLSFYRYVVGASEENPELGQAFSEKVTEPIVDEFVHYLSVHGYDDSSSVLAELYLGLLQGKLWNRALVEPGMKISSDQLSEQVSKASKLFARCLN